DGAAAVAAEGVMSGARGDFMKHASLVALIGAATMTALVTAQKAGGDWPQWRGPNRDGTVATFAEPKSWPDQLTRRWKIEIGTALDATTGRTLWPKPAGPVEPLFHTAQSALVDRGLVILHVGGHKQGALTAFDPATGAVKWSWDGDGPAYGSPIVAEIGGTRQVITFSQENLVGVDAANGQLLWRTPFVARSITNAITPLVYGDRTVIVSGQG